MNVLFIHIARILYFIVVQVDCKWLTVFSAKYSKPRKTWQYRNRSRLPRLTDSNPGLLACTVSALPRSPKRSPFWQGHYTHCLFKVTPLQYDTSDLNVCLTCFKTGFPRTFFCHVSKFLPHWITKAEQRH